MDRACWVSASSVHFFVFFGRSLKIFLRKPEENSSSRAKSLLKSHFSAKNLKKTALQERNAGKRVIFLQKT